MAHEVVSLHVRWLGDSVALTACSCDWCERCAAFVEHLGKHLVDLGSFLLDLILTLVVVFELARDDQVRIATVFLRA